MKHQTADYTTIFIWIPSWKRGFVEGDRALQPNRMSGTPGELALSYKSAWQDATDQAKKLAASKSSRLWPRMVPIQSSPFLGQETAGVERPDAGTTRRKSERMQLLSYQDSSKRVRKWTKLATSSGRAVPAYAHPLTVLPV